MSLKSLKVNEKDQTVTIVMGWTPPAKAPISSTGKTKICASTGGFAAIALEDGTQLKLNTVLTAPAEG